MRWAFKVAYLGDGFHGSQRQPGLRTVEGELLWALQSQGFIDDPRHSRFQMASRTDRGVSALGNVVAFDTETHPSKVISVVNSKLENIWLYAFARTRPDFNPRKARERWYRYFLPNDLDIMRLREASRLFLGTHRFPSFEKGGQGGVCNVRLVEFTPMEGFIALDVRADRFLRNMVRRMAHSMLLYCNEFISLEELRRAVEGDFMALQPSPPEYLVLMDVRYGFEFMSSVDKRLVIDVEHTMLVKRTEHALLRYLHKRLS